MCRSLILLDRDGVLNRMVVDPEHGTIDSPLHAAQVELLPGAADALGMLTRAGFEIAIVTNQPAWAKSKTTRRNLEETHERVARLAQSAGGRIAGSHICFHRAEDGCDCRKPRPGLLRAALAASPGSDPAASWMVGDGITDVDAGARLGLKTAFLGPRKCDAFNVFFERDLRPTYWGADLMSFTKDLLTIEGENR